ncbi:nitroreductase/quinone reductase family protein [Nocardia huaxiensis]|uniref:nitroreductase/quinone reductase family protein n=1 Tax=Nocardia huaxiensis TaxID=2755382 RepID=UPI001E3D5605|nr:nitroreductase/quinone reductase family protein [Nocardia huaxiensis]UFS93837.1 nitroreductase family deazaflavin-dependent oxidoreductase [Nocardia huaxiensis]
MLSTSERLNRRGIYLGRRSTKIHVALYRWSNGRIGASILGWPRARILLLDHVGARTGLRRTSPAIYHQADGLLAIVASKAGQPTNPAWFHNLRANPETTVRIGAEIRPVRARLADDAERNRLWPSFIEAFPAFDFYRRNAPGREIPIIILDPR